MRRSGYIIVKVSVVLCMQYKTQVCLFKQHTGAMLWFKSGFEAAQGVIHAGADCRRLALTISRKQVAGRELPGSTTQLARVPKDSADASSGFHDVCTWTSSAAGSCAESNLGNCPENATCGAFNAIPSRHITPC
jgi:hypothetical protein